MICFHICWNRALINLIGYSVVLNNSVPFWLWMNYDWSSICFLWAIFMIILGLQSNCHGHHVYLTHGHPIPFIKSFSIVALSSFLPHLPKNCIIIISISVISLIHIKSIFFSCYLLTFLIEISFINLSCLISNICIQLSSHILLITQGFYPLFLVVRIDYFEIHFYFFLLEV